MKMCQPHWNKLREAMKDRCIDYLGAKDGKQAADDAVEQLAGRETDYDPLMACNWMITGRALKMGGLYLMGAKEDGSEYCPICEAIEHKPEDVEVAWVENYWIDGPADAVLEECRTLGLANPVQ
jgi:hypothetical protein